jgi:small subunit ribosomal protein S1
MSSDPNDDLRQPETHAESAAPSESAEPVSESTQEAKTDPADEPSPSEEPSSEAAETSVETSPESGPPRRRILIGSQRDPAAYRPKPVRDSSIRIVGMKPRAKKTDAPGESQPEPDGAKPEPVAPAPPPSEAEMPIVEAPAEPAPPEPAPPAQVESPASAEAATMEAEALSQELLEADMAMEESLPSEPVTGKKFPPPNIRGQLPPDLEEEFQQAVGDMPVEDLMAEDDAVTKQPMLEADSQHTGRVVMIRREDVFVELGGREQGILPLKQFAEPPEIDAEVQVRVVRFNREDGLYELTRPGAAANVGDWSELEEGMIVEAKVTGHNTGGLECDVNHIRGFIPVSQIALYRVEDLAQFVDEKFACLVTEANPERRNLVLSRRAVLEREKEEARQSLLASLEPGQVREGVVRKLVDFGAFVDLGGVDGLLHISQLAWNRVNHPSEVLHEGQTIEVKIQNIDRDANRISLAYRDMLENPWNDVEMKYPVNTPVRGKVSKLMEFGAFVELEPGVEGLIHISELSHKRVWRASDIVNEGEEVEVLVLSVDAEAQRISLSMKGLIPEPKPAEKDGSSGSDEPPPPPKPPKKPSQPLKGGLGRSPGGAKFGLKW